MRELAEGQFPARCWTPRIKGVSYMRLHEMIIIGAILILIYGLGILYVCIEVRNFKLSTSHKIEILKANNEYLKHRIHLLITESLKE